MPMPALGLSPWNHADSAVREAPDSNTWDTCVPIWMEGAEWADAELFFFLFLFLSPKRTYSPRANQPPSSPTEPALPGRESSLFKLDPFRHSYKSIDITGPAELEPMNIHWAKLQMKGRRLVHNLCWQLYGHSGSKNFLFSLKVVGRTINIPMEYIYWRIECHTNSHFFLIKDHILEVIAAFCKKVKEWHRNWGEKGPLKKSTLAFCSKQSQLQP